MFLSVPFCSSCQISSRLRLYHTSIQSKNISHCFCCTVCVCACAFACPYVRARVCVYVCGGGAGVYGGGGMNVCGYVLWDR